MALHFLFFIALIASATLTTNVSDLLFCLCFPLHNALSQVFSNSVVIQVPAFKVHQPLWPWGMFPSDAYPVVYGKQAVKRIISEAVPFGWQIWLNVGGGGGFHKKAWEEKALHFLIHWKQRWLNQNGIKNTPQPPSATTSGHSGHSRDRKKIKGKKTVHPNFVQRPIVKLCCFSVLAELRTEHFKAIPSRWEFQARPGLNLKQMSHPKCVVVILFKVDS